MPSVRIVVATEYSETDVSFELPEIRTQGTVQNHLQATLAEAVARACRAHELTPPRWDE